MFSFPLWCHVIDTSHNRSWNLSQYCLTLTLIREWLTRNFLCVIKSSETCVLALASYDLLDHNSVIQHALSWLECVDFIWQS